MVGYAGDPKTEGSRGMRCAKCGADYEGYDACPKCANGLTSLAVVLDNLGKAAMLFGIVAVIVTCLLLTTCS